MLRSPTRPFVSPCGAERSARRTGSARQLSGVQRGRQERRDSMKLSEGPPEEQGSPGQAPQNPIGLGSPSALSGSGG